jgi:uncharacterized protein (TIGR02246 family)
VAATLEHGAAAWNGGDLDGFVSDYTPDATFVTSRGLVRGTAEIRARYAARFAAGAARDSLSFRLLDVDRLGPRTASLVATWVLSRGDSVTSSGPTSLVLKKVGGSGRSPTTTRAEVRLAAHHEESDLPAEVVRQRRHSGRDGPAFAVDHK